MSDDRLLSRLSALSLAPAHRLDDLRDELRAAGYTILELDGAGVRDAASFFAAASEALFDGEPVGNWDSFADLLRNHDALVDADRSALIWTDAQAMLDGGLGDLVTATEILVGISRASYTSGRTFVSWLVGSGPNFA